MKKLLPASNTLSVNKSKGFTLVELLVVISIIAVLSIIGLTVFTGVQKSARDAKRRADVDAISKAIEIHYSTSTGYPTALDCTWFSSGGCSKDPQTGLDYTISPFTTTAYTVKAKLEGLSGNCKTTADNDSYCVSQQQ